MHCREWRTNAIWLLGTFNVRPRFRIIELVVNGVRASSRIEMSQRGSFILYFKTRSTTSLSPSLSLLQYARRNSGRWESTPQRTLMQNAEPFKQMVDISVHSIHCDNLYAHWLTGLLEWTVDWLNWLDLKWTNQRGWWVPAEMRPILYSVLLILDTQTTRLPRDCNVVAWSVGGRELFLHHLPGKRR